MPIEYHVCTPEMFVEELFRLTATSEHLQQTGFSELKKQTFKTEEDAEENFKRKKLQNKNGQ